mgnify:CR=1 FL=1
MPSSPLPSSVHNNPSTLQAWLALIRWKNLLIILITQLVVWACVIVPVSKLWKGVPALLLTPLHFSMLATSTVLIAAAGYIINDYFDIRIDLINKPDKMVLETHIPRRMAIIMHSVFNVIALLLAGYVAHQRSAYEWLLLQFFCTVLLWFYSTQFKRKFMIGNVVVALLTALTIATLVAYEPAMHLFIKKPIFEKESSGLLHLNPLALLSMYAFFAFLLTWMREIVKDMEDIKGDAKEGCETMPIRWGLKKTAGFTQALGIVALLPLLLSSIALLQTTHYILGGYVTVTLIVPLVYWLFSLQKKATTEHYARCSKQLKWMMVAGIGTLIINLIAEWIQLF